MQRILSSVIGVLVLYMGISNGYCQNNYEINIAISSVVFPDTVKWTAITNIDKPDIEFILANKDTLIKSFSTSKIDKERSECSVVERIFSNEESMNNNFYKYDVDGDGVEDIIYTGSAQCSEGDVTIIWFGDGHGFHVRQDILWPMLTLRIKPGKEFMISSMAAGCCGDMTDEYFVGPINNLRNKGRRKVSQDTVLPKKPTIMGRFSAHKNGIVLRSSPKIYDKYDENRSGLFANAVFGNVLAKYISGCDGSVVGQQRDGNNTLWYFVLLDDSCNYSKTHDPYGANVGWVKASEIQIKSR